MRYEWRMSRCTIDAPDAFAAFVLARLIDPVRRGARIEPAAGAAVRVEVDAEAAELAHVLRVVQAWLAEERIAQTTIRYDGRVELLRAA
jgi:hypothetical protein